MRDGETPPLAPEPLDPVAAFSAGLAHLAGAGGDVRATLAGYLALFAGAAPREVTGTERQRFFRQNLAWLTEVFERGQAAGEVGSRLVPEASAMVLLARLEAAPPGATVGPALLAGLMD